MATTSSRSSSPTASELTFYSEDISESDEISHLEDIQLNFADFQRLIERSLAWMLSMEEKFCDNLPNLKDTNWNEKLIFQDDIADSESTELANMEECPIDKVSPFNEVIVNRLTEARKRFNTHEVRVLIPSSNNIIK